MQSIAISIDEPTLKKIDKLCKVEDASRSELIRKALHDFLAWRERLAGEQREYEIIKKHYRELNRDALAALEDQDEP